MHIRVLKKLDSMQVEYQDLVEQIQRWYTLLSDSFLRQLMCIQEQVLEMTLVWPTIAMEY